MKNKKIYSKIFGLSIFVFILFSFFSNTALASYVYINPSDGKYSNVCADTSAACTTLLKADCPLSNITINSNYCNNYILACNPNSEQYVCPINVTDVQTVTGIGTTTPSSTYTLLAPIGGMTTAPTNIGDYFNKIFLIAIGLCGALAVVMIIISGVQYMGDESIFGKTEAKAGIRNALLGLLIALAAYVLLNTINPDLLGKGGVNIQQVSANIDEALVTESSGLPTPGTSLGTQNLCPGGYGDVVVGGQTIMHTCATISAEVTKMIGLARSSGYNLSGSAFRSYADQQALRVKNCADPINTPVNQCTPPTAMPGTSLHEAGLAIDFTCDGAIIQTTDNKCYVWLQNNASAHGLYNLAGEPWHWSTTGH
jgi:hypothetical protein